LPSVPGNSEEVITQKTSELPEVFDRKAELPGCRCNVTEFRYAHLQVHGKAHRSSGMKVQHHERKKVQ
jgi:hypothetical protein